MASVEETEVEVAVAYPQDVDAEDAVASLTLKRDDEYVETITFGHGDTLIVGRRALERDTKLIRLQIDDPIVSKDQFRIYTVLYEEDDKNKTAYMLYCEDLETLNGTDVNGTIIGSRVAPGAPFLLTDGDKIFVQPNWNFEFRQAVGSSTTALEDPQREDSLYFKDRYHLSARCLGSGMFSQVFLAQDVRTRKQLACKVMKLSANTGRERERLLEEVSVLCTLNHPNIVTLQKAFRSDKSLFLFLDLAPGGDLMSFVGAHGGSLSDTYALVIIRQVALAIDYLHSHGVVHRDLKPENILVMYNDIGHRVVVTDFGCASVIRSARRMDSFVGTPNYLAPEVHDNKETRIKAYTKAVDLWSLGVLTFVLLTGESIIDFEERQADQREIRERLEHPGYDDASIRRWNEVSASAKDFMAKLLLIDPRARMTAPEAVKHDWFTKDKKMEKELEMLYERANKDWKPRKVEKGILEIIPGASQDGDEDSPPKAKKLPNMNGLKYFGLDKHLRSYGQSQREEAARTKQKIIDQLKESGETFMRTTVMSTYTSQHSRPIVYPSLTSQDGDMSPHTPGNARPRVEIPRTPTKGRKLLAIRQVDARNMFRNSPEELYSPSRKSQRESQITTQAEYASYDQASQAETQGSMLFNHKDSESFSMGGEVPVAVAPSPSAPFSATRSLSFRQKAPDSESLMRPQAEGFSMEVEELLKQNFSSMENDDSMSINDKTSTSRNGNEKRKMLVFEDEEQEVSLSANPTASRKRTAPRHSTLTQEEKELNKDVLKSLPQFVTAKAFGQKVKERRKGLPSSKK